LRCRLSPSAKTWHRGWCCWLRRERVASFVAACCCGRRWPSQVASVLSRRTGALRLPAPGTATEQSLFSFSCHWGSRSVGAGRVVWERVERQGKRRWSRRRLVCLFGRVTVSSLSNRPCSSASTKRPHTSRSLAQQSSRPSVWDTTLQPCEAESSRLPPTALPRAPLRGRLSLCYHFAFLFLSFLTLRRLAQASPIEGVKGNYTSENRKRRSSAFF